MNIFSSVVCDCYLYLTLTTNVCSNFGRRRNFAADFPRKFGIAAGKTQTFDSSFLGGSGQRRKSHMTASFILRAVSNFWTGHNAHACALLGSIHLSLVYRSIHIEAAV